MKYELILPTNAHKAMANQHNPNPEVMYVSISPFGTEYGLSLVYALLRSPSCYIETDDMAEYLNAHPDLTSVMGFDEMRDAIWDAINPTELPYNDCKKQIIAKPTLDTESINRLYEYPITPSNDPSILVIGTDAIKRRKQMIFDKLAEKREFVDNALCEIEGSVNPQISESTP